MVVSHLTSRILSMSVILYVLWMEKEWNGWTQKIPVKDPKRTTTIFGHINRADGLEKQILSGKICATKSRGRQRTKYTNSLDNFVTRKESPNNELISRTDDREGWKAMIADVCNRPGT